MRFDHNTLFAYIRKAPFGGRLTQQQVDGVNQILEAWYRWAPSRPDIRHLAYIFATAFHETGGRMVAVREGFAKNDKAARRIIANRKYGAPDAVTGHVYYGRGHVQLTWAENYKKMGKVLGLDLYQNPDLALDPKISADILVLGMLRGLYTGRKLSDYFDRLADDPVKARAIVNLNDKANLIAGYHRAFLGALEAADTATPLPQDVKTEDAEPDAPALTTDKTTIGGVVGMLGAGGTGLLSGIDNPWALAAVAIVVLGGLLFLTGRLEIRRKAGA